MVAGAKQKLRPDVDRSLLIRAHVNRSVPVEAQLLLAIIRPRFQATSLMRVAIDSPDFSPLRLGVNIGRIGRIFEHPETVATVHVFPARVTYSARIGRIADPRTVVLQSAVYVVGIRIVGADMIELGNRKIHLVLPAIAAVLAAPQAAIIAGDHDVWILRIDPDVMKIS